MVITVTYQYKMGLKVICDGFFFRFGPLCENYCLNGQLVKDDRQIDQCVCDKNYFGPNCDEIYCNNGGTPAQGNRHCACLMGFFGRFCEGFLNTTRLGSAEIGRRDNFSRDISSSAVSLLLVVLVGFIIYFLVRRRTNRLRMQMRQLAAARQNLATDNQDFIQSQFNGVDGLDPPSYTVAISTPASDMSHFHAEQMLPPPSYDDIVKENLPGTPKPNTASATPPPQLSHQK